MSTEQNKYQRVKGVVEQLFDDSLMLVFESSNLADYNKIFTLNQSAGLVWKLLAEPRNLSDICKQFSEIYGELPERYLQDVESILTNLRNNKLIEIV